MCVATLARPVAASHPSAACRSVYKVDAGVQDDAHQEDKGHGATAAYRLTATHRALAEDCDHANGVAARTVRWCVSTVGGKSGLVGRA